MKALLNIAKEVCKKSKEVEEAEEEDDRDINQLLEFIEGDDKKMQEKKKKKKSKRKSKGANLEAQVEVQEEKVKETSTTAKKEIEANICFLCRSSATSKKLSKCRGCQKVRQHLC